MDTTESFSRDYPEARRKFLEAAAAANACVESVTHPERGPDDGELATDVAWIGPRDAEQVLVLISGTHGVEGFCGSGAQVDWLRRGEGAALPDGLAALLIHAANPYGFAWLRRVNEANIDLNRNWIDFGRPLPTNPGYDALADMICPTEWTEASQQRTREALAAYERDHGSGSLRQISRIGQYTHPAGIFYGGGGPSWSRLTQTRILQTYLAGARRVGIIDYHTGLGAWGACEDIVMEPPGSAAHRRGLAWYGAATTAGAASGIRGDGMGAAPALLSHAEVTALALEFGTLPQPQVYLALRADAWLHAYGDPLSPEGQRMKVQIRAAYYGDAPDWKGMVAGRSLMATRSAVAALLAV